MGRTVKDEAGESYAKVTQGCVIPGENLDSLPNTIGSHGKF